MYQYGPLGVPKVHRLEWSCPASVYSGDVSQVFFVPDN